MESWYFLHNYLSITSENVGYEGLNGLIFWQMDTIKNKLSVFFDLWKFDLFRKVLCVAEKDKCDLTPEN